MGNCCEGTWNYMTQTHQLKQDLHLRLKVTGNVKKVHLFHWICGYFDMDYPFAPEDVARNPNTPKEICTVCKGTVWPIPSLSREQLESIAKQVQETALLPGYLKVKVKSWVESDQCEREVPLPPWVEESTLPTPLLLSAGME